VLLGGRCGLRRTLPQDELTFDAQKLGDAPALLVALGRPSASSIIESPSAALPPLVRPAGVSRRQVL